MFNLKLLKKYDHIYIIGHKNPDADTLISSYLLANVLKSFHIKAEAAILNDGYKTIDEEKDIVKAFFDLQPIILNKDETKDLNFILVDHNLKNSSITHGNVLGCIDHHFYPFNDIPVNYLIGDYASTAEYIYELYKHLYEFSEAEKKLISLTIITDTKFLRTSRYKESDALILKELNTNFDIDELRQEYFRVSNFDLPIADNFNLKHKLYTKDKFVIHTTYLNAFKAHYHYLDSYLKYMELQPENWVLIWYEYDTSKTYVHVKINGITSYLVYNFIASRANDIIKDILKD